MKKQILVLLVLGSFSLMAGVPVKTEAFGYGGNDQIACRNAKAEAKLRLLSFCPRNKLINVAFTNCRFENEGEYFVVFSVKAYGECH